jgi:hypothetical protein
LDLQIHAYPHVVENKRWAKMQMDRQIQTPGGTDVGEPSAGPRYGTATSRQQELPESSN